MKIAVLIPVCCCVAAAPEPASNRQFHRTTFRSGFDRTAGFEGSAEPVLVPSFGMLQLLGDFTDWTTTPCIWSLRGLLEALRDTIPGRRSLRENGKILYLDISETISSLQIMLHYLVKWASTLEPV
jgi:hypothetical protein